MPEVSIVSVSYFVNWIFDVVWFLIIIAVFLSWIPNIDWSHPALRFLRNFTEAILEPFRRIIPPIGGLDISPIIALIFIQFMQRIIVSSLARAGF